jgi:hypothetical protein
MRGAQEGEANTTTVTHLRGHDGATAGAGMTAPGRLIGEMKWLQKLKHRSCRRMRRSWVCQAGGNAPPLGCEVHSIH